MRRRSGQVLIAGATLMLAVMLVSAAMMPTLNTDIDPSSQVYNTVEDIVYTHAGDIVTTLSAYQCAKAFVYSDGSERKVRNTERILKKYLDEIAKKLKDEIEKTQNIKNVKIMIDRAWIDASSHGWNGKAPYAGHVIAYMTVKLTVSFDYTTKGASNNIRKYKYTYQEDLKIMTHNSKAHKINPVQGLGAIQTLVGFVPIVGGFAESIEGVKFDLSLYVENYMVTGTGTDNYKKNLGPKDKDDIKNMGLKIHLDMLKPRKIEKVSYGTKEGVKYAQIKWEEYMKVDWTGIVISLLLDVAKPLEIGAAAGKILQKSLPKKKPSYSDSDNSVEEAKLNLQPSKGGVDPNDFKKMLENYYDDKKVTPIKETNNFGTQTNLNQGRNQHGQRFPVEDIFTDRVTLSSVAEKAMKWDRLRGLAMETQQKIARQWASALDEILKESGSAFDGTAGRYHLLAENVNAKTNKPFAYFQDQDPLLFIALPLHDDKALFASCVWLNGAWNA